jgi:hypothetical protein
MTSYRIYGKNIVIRNNLIQLLKTVENIGEVLNLLKCLEDKPLKDWVLIEKIKNNASKCVRIPLPDVLIELAIELGLINKQKNIFILSELGRIIIKMNNKFVDRFNRSQGKLILPSVFDNQELKDNFKNISNLLIRSPKTGEWFIDSKEILIGNNMFSLRILQQLGFAKFERPFIKISEKDMNFLRNLLNLTLGICEEEFRVLLEKRYKISSLAEEFVLGFEKKRLRSIKKIKLSNLVERVSIRDIGVGYDILSFDNDGGKRFIEVKSSTGLRIYFEWSKKEREMAKLYRKKYWIYFIPYSSTLPNLKVKPILIQDPFNCLGKDLKEEPSSWVVKKTKN